MTAENTTCHSHLFHWDYHFFFLSQAHGWIYFPVKFKAKSLLSKIRFWQLLQGELMRCIDSSQRWQCSCLEKIRAVPATLTRFNHRNKSHPLPRAWLTLWAFWILIDTLYNSPQHQSISQALRISTTFYSSGNNKSQWMVVFFVLLTSTRVGRASTEHLHSCWSKKSRKPWD